MASKLMTSGLIAAATAGAPPALAGAWTFTPDTSLSTAWDDNVALTPTSPLSDYNGRTELACALTRVGARSRLAITPRLVALAYGQEKIYNRTEEYLTVSDKRSGERASSSLALSWTHDTTLTSELGLTGYSQVNKPHQNTTLSWSPGWQQSPRLAFGAQLAASASRYTDAQFTGLVDYNYGSAALSASYALTALANLAVRVSAGQLKVPANDLYDKSNYDATLAYQRDLGQLWQARLSYGPSWIQNRTLHRSDRGEVYAIDLARKSELATFDMGINQEITPNGLGLLARRQQATLNLQRPLTQRLALSVAGTASRTRNVLTVGGLDLNQLRYSDITASLSWSLAPTWNLALSIGQARQAYSNMPGTAIRTHASLGINWDGLEWVLH